MIAHGIKFSIGHGLAGDVALETKRLSIIAQRGHKCEKERHLFRTFVYLASIALLSCSEQPFCCCPYAGRLLAALLLLAEPGPKDRDQPGQGAAQAIGTADDAIDDEGQGKDK